MKNANFAQTFKPEKQYISAILKLAKKNETLTTKEISLETGIPMGESSGKVIPHIEYAKFMGVIDYEKNDSQTFRLFLTDIGEKVLEEDSGLKENLSLILLHSMLVREISGAPVWDLAFSKLFPAYTFNTISVESAIRELNVFYENKINKKNFAPFVNSYSDMFMPLNYFSGETKNELQLSYLQQIDSDFIYLYCLVLFAYWDEKFSGRVEITATEFRELHYGTKLNFSSENEYKVLELLNENNLIRLNRQLSPYTIMKTSKREILIERLYSELF